MLVMPVGRGARFLSALSEHTEGLQYQIHHPAAAMIRNVHIFNIIIVVVVAVAAAVIFVIIIALDETRGLLR